MVCPYCEAEINDGNVYCPKCGREVQMITAVDDLEEEILREFISEDENPGESPTNEYKASAGSSQKKEQAAQRKRKRRNRILILILIIAAAAVAVFGVVRVRQNHSPEYLLRRAQEEYVQNDYDSALRYIDRLLAIDGDDTDALLLAGDIYAAIPDYASAENAYLRVIELDPDNAEAYEGILTVYDAQGKRQEILDLKQNVTNEEILALFDDFITPSPEIKVESGNYTDYLKVEIRAPKKGLTIYYTLDGTTPTRNDTLYTGPVEIQKEGKTILTAVCMDEEGNYSEPASETYQIELAKPAAPSASPGGGEYDYAVTVTVTAPSGTTVYYTWDNSTPGTGSYRYTGPITIPEGNNILSLVAIDSNGKKSDVVKYNYIYYPPAEPETVSEPVAVEPDTEDDTEPAGEVEENRTEPDDEEATDLDNAPSDGADEEKVEDTGSTEE